MSDAASTSTLTTQTSGQHADAGDTPTVTATPTPAAAAPKKKKESFQWNTPADEFADDVGSDEEGEYLVTADEHYEEGGAEAEEGDIIIRLGEDEVDKYAVPSGDGHGQGDDSKGETTEEIRRYLAAYEEEQRREQQQRFGLDRKPRLSGGLDASGRKKKVQSKQKFQCPKCDKIWNWPWELRRHVMTHYKEKEREQTTMYKCEECGKGFQWKRDLAQHKRLHTGEKLLVCSVCEKKFTTRQALLHHVVVHTGEKPFQCAVCGNRFTQPANLRTHMKKKHGDLDIKGNKCPHCQEPFASIIAVHQHILDDHQNIVAEDREAVMMDRLKKAQEKKERERLRELRRQARVERTKDKMDFNDFRSQHLPEWEINYEFHIGEGLVRGVDWDRTPSNGELTCDICDRKFGWRYEVMFHNLCHLTDEHGQTKNRVCPECDTSFKVPIGLKHHLLLHTGELPFLCLHCWRSFSSHIDLKLHIRKEHLFHLEQPKPTVKVEKKSVSKKVKTEQAAAAAAAAAEEVLGAPESASSEQVAAGAEQGETMQLVLAEQPEGVMAAASGAGEEEGQTILLGSDGTIVHTGNQDMIVVIQSDDFDQSQGLIVVDPSQLQQVIGEDGMPVTVVQTQEMVFNNAAEGNSEGRVIVSEGDVASLLPTGQQVATIADGSRMVFAEAPVAGAMAEAAAAATKMEGGGSGVGVDVDGSAVGEDTLVRMVEETQGVTKVVMATTEASEEQHQQILLQQPGAAGEGTIILSDSQDVTAAEPVVQPANDDNSGMIVGEEAAGTAEVAPTANGAVASAEATEQGDTILSDQPSGADAAPMDISMTEDVNNESVKAAPPPADSKAGIVEMTAGQPEVEAAGAGAGAAASSEATAVSTQ